MRFLLKLAFWLTIVVLLLPSDRAQQGATPQLGTSEAVSATGAVVTDVRGFCARQPGACAVGSLLSTCWLIGSYGGGGLHLPSLLAALLLGVFAASLVICGILADAVCANRRLLEDALRRIKQIEARPPGGA